MGKLLTLLLIFSLLMISVGGYVFLSQEIAAGNLKVAAGEKQLTQGEEKLARGEARLASGERELSAAKQGYGRSRKAALAGAIIMPVVGAALFASNKVVGKKIVEGDREVASGKGRVKAGEAELAAGKLALLHGIEELKLANTIKIICGISSIFFAGLLIVFGWRWRKVFGGTCKE